MGEKGQGLSVCVLSHVWLLATPRAVTCLGSSVHGIFQARIPEGVTISSSEDLPNPGIKPGSLALAGGFFTTEPPGKPVRTSCSFQEKNRSEFPSPGETVLGGSRLSGPESTSSTMGQEKHWVPKIDQLPPEFIDPSPNRALLLAWFYQVNVCINLGSFATDFFARQQSVMISNQSYGRGKCRTEATFV